LVVGCVDLDRPHGPGGVTPGDGPDRPDLRVDDVRPDRDVGPDGPGPAPDGPEPDAPDPNAPEVDAPDPDVPGMEAPPVDTAAPEVPPLDTAPDQAPLANGQSCGSGTLCASGNCVEGVCCNLSCGQLCYSCNLPTARGTCTAVPSGQDPRVQCVAQAASTCGRAGGCNGAGACRLHAAGVQCAAQTCAATTETAARTCNGAGLCSSAATRNCFPYLCAASACRTSCTTAADCQTGYTCIGNACVVIPSVLGNLALRWRFDDPSGIIATDSSGNGYNGTYVGDSGIADPSTSVPFSFFANPRSRDFDFNRRHAVTITSIPARLGPAAAATVSFWFNATQVDITGGDAFNLGLGGLAVRIKADEIEWIKRVDSGSSTELNVCEFLITSHLDGGWHHLAAISNAAGLTLYLDGTLRCTEASPGLPVYQSNELWVARNGGSSTMLDYDGLLDDLRYYDRALSAAEVTSIRNGAD
jgi:hypothetical protein